MYSGGVRENNFAKMECVLRLLDFQYFQKLEPSFSLYDTTNEAFGGKMADGN